MRDKAALQRQLTKAWVRGDVEASEIGKATRRYDALDAGQRAEFEDLMQRTGPDGAEFLGQVAEPFVRHSSRVLVECQPIPVGICDRKLRAEATGF